MEARTSSSEATRWVTVGKAHRARRLARGETLWVCACRLIISYHTLSRMENGLQDNFILEDFTPYEVRGSSVWLGPTRISTWASPLLAAAAAWQAKQKMDPSK